MTEPFEDKKQRRITLEERETTLCALWESSEVGRLEVVKIRLTPARGKGATGYVLENIFVEEAFRRAGLGYELLATAMDCFYPLQVPESGTAAYDTLMATAKRKGLLLKTWPKEHDQVAKLRRGRGRLDW